MKNKFYIPLLIAAAFTCIISACNLDKEPSGAADMELETIDDFDAQVRSCYEGLRSGNYYGGAMLILPDVMSDNLIITAAGLQSYRDIFNFNIENTNSAVSGLWSAGYNTILQANRVIEPLGASNKFEGTPDSTASFGLLAEAYAVRAMVHFDMVRLYAPRYVDAATGAVTPAIPYVTSTNSQAKPSRNTLSEVYGAIRNDLTKAYALIGKTGDMHNASVNTRVKQQSIAAILSRVYLTLAANGNDSTFLSNALFYANEAVAELYGTDLLDRNGFYQIWHSSIAQTNPEVLLRIAILDTDGATIGNNYGQSSSDGFRNNYAVNHTLYKNIYNADTTDIRITAYTRKDTYKDNVYAGVYKYRTRGGTSPVNVCDGVVIRTSEMYLTLAECYARLGDDANALSLLNMVRVRRYAAVPSGTPTGSELLDLIRSERRKELAFEGQRFFDLKRLNQTIERGSSGDYIDGNGKVSEVESISASDTKTIWPIPLSETEVNPNLR